MIADRVIVGRAAEEAAIATALDALGSALLLCGEPGIGKSVLLDAARQMAHGRGLRVIATAGVETETALPYAGLQRLLRPLLSGIDALAGAQRQALRAALGLGEGPAGEPLLVALAVLELLTNASPSLVVADDLHWLDPASLIVLGILGRRVRDRPIVLVAATRPGYDDTVGALGLPELALRGLDDDAAVELLAARAGELDDAMRERLLAEAAGNPLALVELPATADSYAETAVLPMSERLERAFAGRLRDVPTETQTLLLVAAADERSRVGEVLATGALLGTDGTSDALTPAQTAGLITIDGDRISYRHPLVRSAIYQSASLQDRLAVHGALARTLAGDDDRRTAHRAAATVTHDDQVAADVEAMGARAHARGAILEAATTLAHAARLTANVEARARRLLESADLAFEAGHPALVRNAVAEAQRLALGTRDRARVELLADSFNDGTAGDVDRVLRLVQDAHQVAALGDTDLALKLLHSAAVRCWWAALEAHVRGEVLTAAEAMPVSRTEPRLMSVIGCVAPLERGAEIVARAPAAISQAGDDPLPRWFVAVAAHAVGEHELSQRILRELVPLLRRSGSFGLLTQALSMAQWDAAMLGDWAEAEAMATEGDRLARDTSQPIWGAGTTCGLSAAAAVRGDPERADGLAAQAERMIVPSGVSDMHSVLLAARGIAAVADGRHDDAFAVLRRAFDPADPAHHYREQFGALGYLAEAAAQAGNVGDAQEVVDQLGELVTPASAPGLRSSLAFAQALLDGRTEPPAYGTPFMRARLQLASGRRLRGEAKRRCLERARAGFDEAGAPPWQEQTDVALRQS